MVRTERLELRIDEDLLQRIDDWMEQTGRASSRSDALRQLVDIGLGAMTGKTIHLSAGDKLNFMLLRDIAKNLKVSTETDVDLMGGAGGGEPGGLAYTRESLKRTCYESPSQRSSMYGEFAWQAVNW